MLISIRCELQSKFTLYDLSFWEYKENHASGWITLPHGEDINTDIHVIASKSNENISELIDSKQS